MEALLRAILDGLRIVVQQLEQIQQWLFAQRSGRADTPVQVVMPERIRVQEPLRVVSDTGSYVTGEMEILNIPLPVSQSGAWTVGIANQPIGVNVQNTPLTVGISGQPIQTRYQDVLYAPINASTSGDTQIVAGVAGRRIRVIAYAVVANASVNIKFRSGTSDITGSMRVVEGGGIAHAYDNGLFQTAVGQALQINLSVNATVGGYVVYREV